MKMFKFETWCLAIFIIIKQCHTQENILPIAEIKTLSELPLDKLLTAKSCFSPEAISDDEETKSDYEVGKIEHRSGMPEALPLKSLKANERGGHEHYEPYEESGSKKGKFSSLLQISITALSFLAFGGYLLCLLVQAVKGKTMDMMGTTMMSMTYIRPVIIRAPVRRRTTRRPTRKKPQRGSGNRRPGYVSSVNKRPRSKRDANMDFKLGEIDAENMYHTLISLSEAYTKYHTIDYKHFNYTRTGRF